MNENNCVKNRHRLSDISWHHINKNTTMPIVVCRDCNRILSGSELLRLEISTIVDSDGKDSYLK